MLSRKASVEVRRPKSAGGPPPPYDPSPLSPIILAETRTTRTEVITTTTTETTTHLFSLPHWRKRNAPLPPSPPRQSIDADSSQQIKSSRTLLFDKALPPTPPNEEDTLPGLPTPASSSHHLPTQEPHFSRPRIPNGGQHSPAGALAHAALGIGLPHASYPMPRPATAIALMASPPSSPAPPEPASSPSMRRVKSSQRLQLRHVSDNPGSTAVADQLVQRRRRGLSFGASTFLSIGIPDAKAKPKEAEASPKPSTSSPKPIARKSSFWTKKKGSQAIEPATSKSSQEGTVLTIPPLPPVLVSPFQVSEFPPSPPPMNHTHNSPSLPEIARSQSENGAFPKPPPETPSSPSPRPSISQITSSAERTSDSQSSIDSHTPSRLRPQTNSPLLHRLSMAVFHSTESASTPNLRSNQNSQPASPSRLVKKANPVPKPLSGQESPEIYLTRLKSAVSKAEVAGILASSSDPFYAQALRAYINQFAFLDIPLDVALRRLLMEVGLPRETQQIDRVMEAFAARYMECNPNYFISEDHPYILAFSLIMLHTDAFNPSNKRKMTKADYIKNTKLPGISGEVLDCFFDNIVFAPFIFIEDPVDFNGQPGLTHDVVARSMTLSTPTTAVTTNGMSSPFKMGNKVDPYYLITNELLDPLRVDVNSCVPLVSPYSYEGTNGPWDEPELHHAFVNAYIVEIDVPPFSRAPTMFSLSPSGTPGPIVAGFNELTPLTRLPETWNLKVTKVGVLNRKDDLLEGGKKAMNRKWKACSVVLTGSQLLFFRDPSWASALQPPSESSPDLSKTLPASVFRPDELFSVKDAIAVYDRSYTKYEHTLRFVLPDGRHLLLQASDDHDLNEWISRINYASTFKTAGVRMRSLGLSGEDVLMTGVAAATSHLHDMQKREDPPRPHSWGSNAPNELMGMLTSPPPKSPVLKRRVTLSRPRSDFDMDVPVAPEIEGAEQFKATFDQVKADLAARSWSSQGDGSWLPGAESIIHESPPASPASFNSNTSRLPSRSQIILTKIHDLDSKIAPIQTQLDSDERYVRNIAILTPFQKSTRSRLTTAVQGVARRVMQVRLEMEKLKCHRAVLRGDLASEGRSWNQSKRAALRAAKDSLQSRRVNTIPTMTLSLLEDRNKSSSSQDFSQILRTPVSARATSSTCGSFHSANEAGFDWPSSEDMSFLTTSPKLGPPRPERSNTASSVAFPSSPEDSSELGPLSLSPSLSSSVMSSTNIQEDDFDQKSPSHSISHDDDEQAEEWNKTRAAQRVSLIHVPADIGIAKRLKGVVEAETDTD